MKKIPFITTLVVLIPISAIAAFFMMDDDSNKAAPPLIVIPEEQTSRNTDEILTGVTVNDSGEFTIPDLYKSCETDFDCTEVPHHCGYCGCGKLINRRLPLYFHGTMQGL